MFEWLLKLFENTCDNTCDNTIKRWSVTDSNSGQNYKFVGKIIFESKSYYASGTLWSAIWIYQTEKGNFVFDYYNYITYKAGTYILNNFDEVKKLAKEICFENKFSIMLDDMLKHKKDFIKAGYFTDNVIHID